MSAAGELTLEELSQYFSFPISEAAKQIGVCATVLKKICRKNNIPRWPHRKIKSINKMIGVLESSLGKNGEDDARIREEIKILIQHREFVMKNPDTLVKNYNKRKRDSKTSGPKPEKHNNHDVVPVPPPKKSKPLDKESSPKPDHRVAEVAEPPIRSDQPVFEEYITAPMMTSFPYYGQPVSMEEWMRMTATGGPTMLHAAYGLPHPHAHLYAPAYSYAPEAVDLHHFMPGDGAGDPPQPHHMATHPHAFIMPGVPGMENKWMTTLPHSMQHGMLSPAMQLPHGMQPLHQQLAAPQIAQPQPPQQQQQQQQQQPQQSPQPAPPQGSPRNSSSNVVIKQELTMTPVPTDMGQHQQQIVQQQQQQQQQSQQPPQQAQSQQSQPLSFGMASFSEAQPMQSMQPIQMGQSMSAPPSTEPPKPHMHQGPVASQVSGGSLPVQQQHMMSGGPQPQQVPEWFHEEKDNYMTLQERMGLV